jgi:amino acid adenylation domain-containing protein
MGIRQALEGQAQQNPSSSALLSLERTPLTYSRLLTHCHRVMTDLNHAGISRGDRVAVVLPNGPEMAACLLAVAMGASCAPLNPNYRRSELEFYLSDLAPRALIVEEGADLPAIAVAESLGIRMIRLRLSTTDAAGIFTLDLPPAPANIAPVFAQPDDEALVLHTSGTTARPKMVPLTQANLAASAGNIAASLGLDPSDRCLNVMPLFHIHGFVGALLSTIVSGGSFACTPGFQAPRFFDWCEEFAPTWYTAVPTMHQAVLARATENPARVVGTRLRFIRSCSAPLSPDLMAELEQTLQVPVLEAYGMTEASHQIATNPQPPAARKPGSVGLAFGTDVAIMDADGNLLAPGEIGEIVVRGPGVFAGYANNPEANRTSFVNGWFRTGDNGRLDRDGYLFITGRIKEIINRGGQKISPREIDEVLCTHPAVANAVAFAVPDHRLGEDVAAAVVLRPGHAASEIEIRNHAANRIAQYKVPRHIVFLDELPKGPTGKLQRIGLAAQLGLVGTALNSSSGHNEFVAPSTPTEKTLTGIWEQVLGVEPIGVHDDFLALGGDSMLAALIIARIRDATGAPLSILAFFEHSTVAELGGLIDRGGEDRLDANNPIVAFSMVGDLPLSSAQRRMWFLAELEERSTAYHRSNLYRIRGPLEPHVLERALNRIVARHAVLRTTFQSRDGEPVQTVTAPAAIEIAKLDLSETPEATRIEAAVAAAIEASNRPFNLTRDPMLRPLLIKLGENDQLLLLTIHHIAFDGWSAGVLMRELSVLYAADATDNGADASAQVLQPLAIQYLDFAQWQSQAAHGPAMNESLAWWHDRLTGVPPLLPLPTDRPRPPRQTFSGAAETFLINSELVDRLKGIARSESATLFMTLLAGFQTMLHRYCGSDDIVVGTPVAGRTRVETEGLIGLFVNMLAMRGDLSGDPTFRDLLRKTRDRALEAYAHQDLPFDAVVEALHPERNLSYPPIVQVTFQIRNYPLEDTRLDGLQIEELDFDPGISPFDLSLEVTEKSQSLFCKLIYNRDIFDRTTIARMAAHFETILDGIATDADQHISRLPMLTDAERHQLLVEWNDTRREYPNECVHQLFEAQTEKTPEAVAVLREGEELSYRELNRRANQLAHYLRELGVGPEVLVGICVERSLEMVVGLLGILKAGGAYVPLDPTYPKERLAYMAEDAQVPVLLTQRRLLNKLPDYEARTVILDAEWSEIAQRAAHNPATLTGPDNLAYVIYTSGSTGTPKGVMIRHQGLANYLGFCIERYPIAEGCGSVVFSSIAFDLTITSLFPALLLGKRIVVESRDQITSIPDGTFSVLKVTPAHLSLLAQVIPPERIATLARALVIGGEALSGSEISFWQRHARATRLINEYGPTETVVGCSTYEIVGEHEYASVPIGKPIANTEIYVLDKYQNPVPVGVAGELYIGGAGLARGYLGRPGLTAEKFIADPFSGRAGARLYRTGDLGRYLPDGNIEFIGRVDSQVKIRGYRIELSEIESTLLRHPAVHEAVVVAQEHGGDARLVAYVSARRPSVPTVHELRSHLKERLPHYMVPAAFAVIDAFPLTSNGKIDRANLPAIDASAAVDHRSFVAPRDDVERRVAAMWQELLNVSPIGIHDDFFAMGGHSLLAAKLLARIEREFNRRIPLTAMFPAPTIATIAARIGDAKDSDEPATVPIQPLGSLPPLYVVGNYPVFRQLALKLAIDRPTIGISIPDEFRIRLPYDLEQLAALQVKSILNLNKGEPIFLIGFSAEGVLAYEVARQLVAAGREVGLIAMIDTACPSQPRESRIQRIARSTRLNLRTIRSVGIERAPAAIADVLSRLALRLKFRAWKLAGRVGIMRAPVAPKRPADLVMAMVLATRRYVPSPYRGRVVLFKQTADPGGRFRLKDYGWGEVVRDGLEICEIPGDHLSLLVEPGVATVAAKLDAAMKSAGESPVELKSAAA